MAPAGHLGAHPDRQPQILKGLVSKHPPQQQGPLLGLKQAEQLLEPLAPFEAAGPFERIEAAWIGQDIGPPLASPWPRAIAVPVEPWPGLIEAGDPEGPLCRTGLTPAPDADPQHPRQSGLGQGPLTPLLPFELEPLAPAMEFAQAAAGAQGLATVPQVLANGSTDVGHSEAAQGRAAGRIKGFEGLNQAEVARLLQVFHGHGCALAFAPGQLLHQGQVGDGELVALLAVAVEGIGHQAGLVLTADGADRA